MRTFLLLTGVAALAVTLPASAMDDPAKTSVAIQNAHAGWAPLRVADDEDEDDDDDDRRRRWRGGGDDDDDDGRRRWRGGDDDDDDDDDDEDDDGRGFRGRDFDGDLRGFSREQRRIERFRRELVRDERRRLREARRFERRFFDREFDDDDFRFRDGFAFAPYAMPAGLFEVTQLIGHRLPLAGLGYNLPDRYRPMFYDNRDWLYRYDDDGYVYRLDRDSGLLNAVIPLFGGDLIPGQPMPLGYSVYNLPFGYRSAYPDTADDYYRYDDGAIYRINRDSLLVEGIAALLTGGGGLGGLAGLGGLGIGDPLPTGYDVYNVPFDYRDAYYDTNDAWYRYADGNIYQVDPQTRLIQAVISLLA